MPKNTNKPGTPQTTQLYRAKLALKSLAKDITVEDRDSAIEHFGARLSLRQYYRYVTEGIGNDLDLYVDLVRYFKRRIHKRERDIQAVLSR